jgi:hypothetical protein
MEKNTKILIGAGALALAYYLYNSSKAAAAVTPITTTPITPIVTNPIVPITTTSVVTTPVGQVIMDHAVPDSLFIQGIGDIQDVGEKIDYAAQIAAADAAAKSAQAEIDRLAKVQAQQDENARQQAIMEAQNKANQEAYLKAQADIKAMNDANVAAAKAIKDAADKAAADNAKQQAANDAARQAAMNAFVYGPTCPSGTEYYNGQCMPSYMVQQMKVTAQANNGEGYILHDYSNNTTTLVKTCPAGYVKQGVNCVPASSLSQSQLDIQAKLDAGLVQTSDGQWYKDAASAAAAQARIDAAKAAPVYSDRQTNINAAICSVNTSGVIINPYSAVTNGMSLNQYIGENKITAAELGIARASCPSSVYSSGRIAGGMTNDAALGYVVAPISSSGGYTNTIKAF